ncbi:MAG TPA: rod shape-determining protein RodA [Caulobacteraceae bacterium]|nr:rod shape-determining protein RodA [Caulobacteraceae bacterium]
MTVSAMTRPGERDRLSVKLGEIDWNLCAAITAIALTGGAMLYSVAGGNWTWAAPQLLRYGLWFAVMLVLAVTDLRVWRALAYPLYFVALALLVFAAVHGHSSLGARRWINLGPIHEFQPSEVMKIGLVLALARFYHDLSAKSAQASWWLLVPALLIAVPVGLVIKEPDLGTALLIAAIGLTMMILAGLSWRLIAAGAVLAGIAAPLAIKVALKPYQLTRLLTFLNPEADKSGAGYHIMQSKIALGSGGLLGKGFGLGSQAQLNFLPEKQTDFIFASLAEDFGFVGSVAVLLVYAAVIFMCLRIAMIAHSHFGRLSAAGITATLAFCVLMNGAMVMGLAPVVGVPMPLLSWGGTVMMTMMIGFGLVLAVRVHRYSEVTSGAGSML